MATIPKVLEEAAAYFREQERGCMGCGGASDTVGLYMPNDGSNPVAYPACQKCQGSDLLIAKVEREQRKLKIG